MLKHAFVFVFLMFAVLTGLFFFYQDRALPQTFLGDLDVSHLRSEEIRALLQQQAQAPLRLEGKNASLSGNLQDWGIHIDIEGNLAQIMQQHAWIVRDPRLIWQEKHAPLLFTTVELPDLSAWTLVPRPAEVYFEPRQQRFHWRSAVEGYVPDQEALKRFLESAAWSKESTYRVNFDLVYPEFDNHAADHLCRQLNALLKTPLDLTYIDGERSERWHVGQEVIATWIDLHASQAALAPRLRSDKVQQWLEDESTVRYRLPQHGRRLISKNSGKILKVYEEKQDGWSLLIDEESVAAVESTLRAGGGLVTLTGQTLPANWIDEVWTAQPRLAQTPDLLPVDDAWLAPETSSYAYAAAPGEKWIDIDLSNHTITAYESDQMVMATSYMVHGKAGTPTVTGRFRIDRKYRRKDMRGQGYFVRNVPWAMYFHRGYAIHGAPWRSRFGFGGRASGSHGCINLPVDLAYNYYEWADIGTLVVIHH